MRAGRSAFRPSAADRDRVLASLRGRLGNDVFGTPPPAAPPGPHRGGWFGQLGWRGTLFVGVSMLCVGVGILMGRGHPETAPLDPATAPSPITVATTSAAAEPAEPAPTTPEASVPPEAPREERTARPPSSGPVLPSASHRSDDLSEEVRLLSRAERDLHGGRAEGALRALTEHERRFPSGALAEERLAARVQALCAGGRRPEANAYLAQLTQRYPRSPHLKRARAACGLGPDSAP